MAEPRIYSKWGGNPRGTAENVMHCIEAVYPPGNWYSVQCSRKRGHGPDGLYCKQHGKRKEYRAEFRAE